VLMVYWCSLYSVVASSQGVDVASSDDEKDEEGMCSLTLENQPTSLESDPSLTADTLDDHWELNSSGAL